MEKELRIKTAAGEIVAYPNADPDYPGITVMFKPNGADYEIDMFSAECHEGEKDYDNVYGYTWEDVTTEDCTRRFTLNRIEALEALEFDFNMEDKK